MDNRIGQALTNSVAMLGARMHEVVRQEMTMQRFQEQNPHFFENDQKSSKFYENLNQTCLLPSSWLEWAL